MTTTADNRTPPIRWLGMTRAHFQAGRPGPIRALVVHATAGIHPGDLGWLRKGGDAQRPVSCHYYIDKMGVITQLVRDEDTAWHAGVSTWTIDGRVVSGLNACSLGIELENRNDGRDRYPAAQVDALVALSRALTTRYAIPRSQFVRHVDISPGRKTDPLGLDWASVVARVYPLADPYTADSPILGESRATVAQCLRYITRAANGSRRPTGEYTDHDLGEVILPAYWHQCQLAGVPVEIAFAQCLHETALLTSALSQRRDRDGRHLRNPAGIGVTGASSPVPLPGYVWDADRQIYRACCQFSSWTTESIPAHLGRLLAYALPRGAPTTMAQETAIRYALRVRSLPDLARGTAPTLKPLGREHNPQGHRGIGWASPGTHYGEAIARIANAIRSQPL